MGASSIHTSLFASDQVEGSRRERINLINFEDVLRLSGERRIAILKVDIEGAEKDLFSSLPPVVLGVVERVVLEYHDHIVTGSRQSVESALIDSGFSIVRVVTASPGKRHLVCETDGSRWIMGNVCHAASCPAPFKGGGMGRHSAKVLGQLRTEGRSGAYFAASCPVGDPDGMTVRVPWLPWVMQYTPARFSPEWKSFVVSYVFYWEVARQLPPGRQSIYAFAAAALKTFRRACALGYTELHLESASAHVRHVRRMYDEPYWSFPIEGDSPVLSISPALSTPMSWRTSSGCEPGIREADVPGRRSAGCQAPQAGTDHRPAVRARTLPPRQVRPSRSLRRQLERLERGARPAGSVRPASRSRWSRLTLVGGSGNAVHGSAAGENHGCGPSGPSRPWRSSSASARSGRVRSPKLLRRVRVRSSGGSRVWSSGHRDRGHRV